MIRLRVWISGALLLLAVVIIFSYELLLKPRAEERREKSAIVFPNFVPEKVAKIEISRGEKKDVLVKKDDKWLVESEDNYPADPDAVDKIIKQTKELTCSQVVSTSKKQFDRFDLTKEKALEVKFLDKDSKLLAHFFIGKRGPTYSSSYFRKADEAKTCLAYKNLVSSFDKTNDTWKDKAIFRFNADECKKLVLQDGNTVITLEKDFKEKKWFLVKGEEKKLAKEWVVDGICQTLSRLRTQDFPKINARRAGLNKPQKKITAFLPGEKEYTLFVGKKVKDKDQYYVQRKDWEQIFVIEDWQLNSLFKKEKDLVEEKKEKEESSQQTHSESEESSQ